MMDILGYAKAHPKESAAAILAGVAGTVLMIGRVKGPGATAAASAPANPGTAYTIPMDQPPQFNFTIPDYTKSPNFTPAPSPSPSPTPSPSPGGQTGTPNQGTGKEQLYGLHIPAPANVMAKYKCPSGYHFAPELGGTGNWVCRPNRGANGKNDIAVLPK